MQLNVKIKMEKIKTGVHVIITTFSPMKKQLHF